MWWYLLYYVVPPVSGAITLAGIIGMLAVLIRWQARRKRERREINQRLEQQLKRSWTCWRCGWPSPGDRPRPLCLCSDCLDMYLHEVA